VTERSSPDSIDEHAQETLEYIRDTMARAGRFTALPGRGGVLMGLTALATATVAGTPGTGPWLDLWLAEAAIACTLGVVTMWLKARRLGTPLTGVHGVRFALAFAPGLAAGLVLTMVFSTHSLTPRLPGCWLLIYGAAVTSGGATSVRVVPWLGVLLMGLGTLAFVTPVAWGNGWMALGFGALHVLFGLALARRHGG
jgi:hypothetical protein